MIRETSYFIIIKAKNKSRIKFASLINKFRNFGRVEFGSDSNRRTGAESASPIIRTPGRKWESVDKLSMITDCRNYSSISCLSDGRAAGKRGSLPILSARLVPDRVHLQSSNKQQSDDIPTTGFRRNGRRIRAAGKPIFWVRKSWLW